MDIKLYLRKNISLKTAWSSPLKPGVRHINELLDMIKNIVISLFILLLASACLGPGPSDYSFELPNGYNLYRTSGHQVFVSPSSRNSGTPIIPAKVVRLGWDNRFMLAEQEHLKRRNPNNPNDSYMIPSGAFSFWVLDTQKPKAFGPLNKSEFEKLRVEMGIDGINMKGPDEYK